MNREIKFRAFVETHDGKEMINNWCFLNHKDNHFNAVDITNERPDIGYVYAVMQYTGLKDMNGKEIYEGDILQWVSSNPFSKGEIRKVQVNYVQAQFWCQGTIGVYLAELLVNEKCEIIGNIYENKIFN